MVTCEDCGEEFDTDQGLWIHRKIEHEEAGEWEGGGLGATLVDAVREPRYAFILGALFGVILVVSIVMSAPAAFWDDPGRIGTRTLAHYQKIAPPGVSYDLQAVEQHDSGLYAVTLQVSSGTLASNETVYVSRTGGYVFESPPSELEADVAALGRQ